MTSYAHAAPSGSLKGHQRPRLLSLPPSDDNADGSDAIELAAHAGLKLDEWQQFVLRSALATRGNKWAAFEVAAILSRQNGKGALLEARELAGLFLLGERLILHSAHEFKTAADAFRRILALIQENPDFDREVARVIRSHGNEVIEMRSGQRLRFVARSSGSGRGFAADLVVFDEAYELGDDEMAAMLPTLSTRPNPQVWYTSTAGGPTSVQLGRIRQRGLTGADPSLAFFEWSVDPDAYDPADPECWAQSNPGMGIRISREYIELERAALSADAFERERLGIGLYPTDLADAWLVIGRDVWAALTDPQSKAKDPVAFAVEVTLVAPRKQPWASIAAVGMRADGRLHVEVIEHRKESDWVIPRMAELRKHRPVAVVVDPSSHAGALTEGLLQAGIEPAESFTARDAAQAFGFFRDTVLAGGLRHLGQESLNRSLAGATTRPLADALAWDRRDPRVDLGPVVSVSLAAWGFRRYGMGRIAPYDMLRSVS